MDKQKVNMTDWELNVYNNRYKLSGVAEYHPRLGRNAYVAYTSDLVEYSFEKDILVYETLNTIYICPLKYMRTDLYVDLLLKYKEELVHMADNSDDCLNRIIAASAKLATKKDLDDDLVKHIVALTEIGQHEIAEKQRIENERLISIANQYEDSIYLEVSNIGTGNKLAYHLGDYHGIVEPCLHSGMFRDSILYMKYRKHEDDCAMDFRYFPMGFGSMETYSWSDNIQKAVIKNDMQDVIIFNQEEIAPNETKIFTQKTHKQGLVSPDCYSRMLLKSLYVCDRIALRKSTHDRVVASRA